MVVKYGNSADVFIKIVCTKLGMFFWQSDSIYLRIMFDQWFRTYPKLAMTCDSRSYIHLSKGYNNNRKLYQNYNIELDP